VKIENSLGLLNIKIGHFGQQYKVSQFAKYLFFVKYFHNFFWLPVKKDFCPLGFKCQNFDGDYACIDIDECQPVPGMSGACHENQRCINRIGGFDCVIDDPCFNITCQNGHNCFDTREIFTDKNRVSRISRNIYFLFIFEILENNLL